MEFNINPKHLHDALLHTVAEKKSALARYSHALISAEGEAITVTTCDGARELEVKIPAAIKKAGSATFDVQRLKSSLVGLEGEISVTLAGKFSSVKQGRRHFKFPSEDVEEFPTGPEMGETDATAVGIDLVELADAIDGVAYAVPTNDPRIYLNGVALWDDWVVAADGFRMAAVPLKGVPSCLIPKDSVANLTDALRSSGAILWLGKSIEVTSDTLRFRTALVDAKPPGYSRQLRIPDNATTMKATSRDIKAGLARALPFADSFGDRQTKLRRISISRDGDTGRLTAGGGDAVETFAAAFSGEWKEIFIDPGFFSDAISACGDQFEWISASQSDQQFFIPDSSDAIHIVMPQKV
ncbi:MAG: DNA polymerase III subunit beta [Candidatus Sedimenticola sp. (ex Thyasira tokunagai)]